MVVFGNTNCAEWPTSMCLTLNLKSFIFTKVENETFPLSSTPYYTACIVNFEEGAV